MKSGFTLIEMLIAMAISSMVALGLFSMFSSITSIKDRSVSKSESILTIDAITKIINKDTRMMLDNSMSVDSSDKIKKLKFKTQNSLRFNKSLPIEVTYFIDDENWLVRRETNTNTLFEMNMRLIPNVTEMDFEFYDGKEYKPEVPRNGKLFKVHMTIDGNILKIFSARTFSNS